MGSGAIAHRNVHVAVRVKPLEDELDALLVLLRELAVRLRLARRQHVARHPPLRRLLRKIVAAVGQHVLGTVAQHCLAPLEEDGLQLG